MEPVPGVEPEIEPYQGPVFPLALHRQDGAGEPGRTAILSLEDWSPAFGRHPRDSLYESAIHALILRELPHSRHSGTCTQCYRTVPAYRVERRIVSSSHSDHVGFFHGDDRSRGLGT